MEILPIASWTSAPLLGSGLGRALAVSLLVHLALFWPSAPDGRTAVAAAPLLAVLRPNGQPAERQEIPAISASSPPRLIGARERVVSKKLVAIEDAEPRAVQPPVNGSSVESESRDRATERGATNLAPALPAALPATPGLDAEGLRGFRLALAREARRYKQYPAQAIETGWQGTVEVEVAIRAGGVAKDARLARTSGHSLLDSVAVDMITRALATTAVPAVLRDQDFLMTLPVMFELPQ